jgi:nickel transport system ATP-binding protein
VGFDEPGTILPLYPFQMSGGMLQRVMIALALALDVDFLLADEATTDLDAVSQRRVLDLVESLVRDRGLGVLLVTHDLSVIARLADEVLVMRNGVLLERGNVHGIFNEPRHSYTISLLEAHYRLYSIGIEARCN